MADAVVDFLLENLKQLLLYNADLISGVEHQVRSLQRELGLMKAFLKDCKEKRSDYAIVRELVRQIRDVSYRAENIIDTFVVTATMHKARNTMGKFLRCVDHSLMLRNVAQDIEGIKAQVKGIYDNKFYGIEVLKHDGEPSRRRRRGPPVVEEDNVVGFDEEAKTVIERLTNGSEQLEVITIVGMGGLGKTTLAKKVYNNPSIEFQFCTRAWTYVSQEYSRREVFFNILSSLTQPTELMSQMTDENLREELCRHLKNTKYLIVIDDVWSKEAWEDLKNAFPNSTNGSRILLTSRNREVAIHAYHGLRFLSENESWELLCLKVFGKGGSCPSELEKLGWRITKKCDGLPLAIVVVAGLLSKKDKTHYWWKRVADGVNSYFVRDPKQCLDVLALSYRHLPDYLQLCFIYFGVFPEDYEIPVWLLIRLWVAEGFIVQIGQECMEDIAEDYLEDLVDRSLILVAKRRSNGRIKTCRIHDMLRDLCLREAAEEKILPEIKGYVPSSSTPLSDFHRCLCVHSQILDYISSKPRGPHVRSFLCFSLEKRELPREQTSFIFETFKLLRVMDVRSISLSRFPSEIIQLVHLRYIALFGNFTVLPASVSSLWNLQTLIVKTTSRNLDIKVDIWKMLQFRHLYTNGSGHLHGPPAKSRSENENHLVGSNIQTISTVSPDSCTENILARTRSLKKLGIRGKLIMLVEERGESSMFDNLAKLNHLETLKLLNDTFPCSPSERRLPSIPQPSKFPPNLKKLTLADTFLDWAHMSTLGKLPNLEILKLKDNAFQGPVWIALDGGFRLLKVLQIGRTDLVNWEASAHHFPRLQHIVLKHCENLEDIPFGLARVSALQVMELYCTSPSAAASARRIQKEQHDLMGNSGLKLTIYPPDL